MTGAVVRQGAGQLLANTFTTTKRPQQNQEDQCEVPKKTQTFIFPQTITTFDIILISSYICYFSTLGTRYRKYKHDLLNQRRHSIPLENETRKLEEIEMVKNSPSRQPNLHHQNRAVEAASLSKHASALRKKVRDLFFRFQSKKMLNYLFKQFWKFA